MSIFFKKNKKFISALLLILLVSGLGVFVFNVKQARAGIFDWLVEVSFESVAWIIARIGAVIHFVVSLFFYVGAMLLEIAFGLEKFTEAGVVKIGWTVTRDLVNMFFVLVLLIIALATILRLETYGMKQILWKLIVIALLINFSLVICGAIIDSSQVLTHFFYDEIRGTAGISTKLADITKIQKVWELNEQAAIPEEIAAGAGGVIMMIFSIFFGIIIILTATLAIGIGALFLIVRLIALWILLILAPIAWFFWILPYTSAQTKKWWGEFLKWTFFAPIYTFFIWLAIKAADGGAFTGIIQQETENIINSSGFWSTIASTLASTPSFLLQFIVVVGLLFGGLIVAQKLSISGAGGAMKIAAGTGKWVGKKARTYVAKPIAERAERGLTKIGVQLEKTKIGKPLGKGIGQIARAPRALIEQERAATAKLEERYKPWTDDHLKSEYGRADARGKVMIAKILATRGELEAKDELGFREDHIKEAAGLAKKYEQHGDIVKARLDLTPLTEKIIPTKSEDIIQVITKQASKMKPAHMEKIQSKALKDDNVKTAIKNQLLKKTTAEEPNHGKWKSNHLAKLAETNPEIFRVIAEEIQKEITSKEKWEKLEKERPDIANYLKSAPGKSIFGEIEWTKEKKEEPIISSSTEADFKKAREEGYRGK